MRVGLIEALGLRPFGKAASETWLMLRGDATTPKSRYDLTALRQLRPRMGLTLWLGGKPAGRRVPITNLYNYRQPPPELGWSVCVTDVLDFTGGGNTYDSHNGTDLAIPPGTSVVAAAPGRVLRVSSEFHRGGRKVLIDHGRGLVTTYNHLSRPLVEPGQRVKRGEAIAISGYSGVDALVTFPFGVPHVHFNTWLNGAYVDPFVPLDSGEVSLWREHNDPTPATGADLEDDAYAPTEWDEAALARAIDACLHAGAREEMERASTLEERAASALLHLNYFPTRFDRAALGEGFSVYRARFPREPRLDLPFSHRDYDGVQLR